MLVFVLVLIAYDRRIGGELGAIAHRRAHALRYRSLAIDLSPLPPGRRDSRSSCSGCDAPLRSSRGIGWLTDGLRSRSPWLGDSMLCRFGSSRG
jgi:hypothetical protein